MSAGRVFVGIGFGAIQAGLYLREAKASGTFARTVVALRRPELASALAAAGEVRINTALGNGLRVETLGGIEARCLADEADRARLHADLVAAHEIAVAVSSVGDYATKGPGSLDRLLAAAISEKARGRGPKALIYSSENNNDAARLLEEAILSALPEESRGAARGAFQTVDTVIGKMSRVVTEPSEIASAGLAPALPGGDRAFLVEAFNRIFVSRVDPARTSGRGIATFTEKDDLLPFEHAKLFGHNATHAGLAYAGQVLGIAWMSEVLALAPIRSFFREAFLEESGAAMIRLHGGSDPLFTPAGYAAYVDDLLERMANPWLRDSCERIGRDAERKLGWDDRLIGTIRLARGQGIPVDRYGIAALAGLEVLGRSPEDMRPAWQRAGAPAGEAAAMAAFLAGLAPRYRAWIEGLAREARPLSSRHA
jgi:mannitol-1-phosphate 5-dehydrogenase